MNSSFAFSIDRDLESSIERLERSWNAGAVESLRHARERVKQLRETRRFHSVPNVRNSLQRYEGAVRFRQPVDHLVDVFGRVCSCVEFHLFPVCLAERVALGFEQSMFLRRIPPFPSMPRGTLKSLHQFVFENRVPFAIRFHADPPALQTVDTEIRRGHGAERVRYRLLSLPLYLVERLPRIIDGLPSVV